jgi:DNA-binding beta-propeller fold protein YncE
MLLATVGLAIAGCSSDTVGPMSAEDTAPRLAVTPGSAPARGRVVVANRASGTISVIDAKTNNIVGTYALPAGPMDAMPEPMYVAHIPRFNRVFVGDRANSRIAVFDARSFAIEGTAPAGNGVFHMWADPQGSQLWVNNDIDNTSTVIDPATLTVIGNAATPADLVALGGKPHDVIVGPEGLYAYVSVLGVAGANDYVVQYDTATLLEIGRAAVGKDPHVSLARQNDRLYVPCQNSDVVVVLDRFTMAMVTSIAVPGAHGAGMSTNGRYFYATNLPGGGTNALYTIDTETNTVVGSAVDSPYPVPHNIALTSNGKTLFVTHSGGASDKVTVYGAARQDPVPAFVAEVVVGLNPFGLAYVP